MLGTSGKPEGLQVTLIWTEKNKLLFRYGLRRLLIPSMSLTLDKFRKSEWQKRSYAYHSFTYSTNLHCYHLLFPGYTRLILALWDSVCFLLIW